MNRLTCVPLFPGSGQQKADNPPHDSGSAWLAFMISFPKSIVEVSSIAHYFIEICAERNIELGVSDGRILTPVNPGEDIPSAKDYCFLVFFAAIAQPLLQAALAQPESEQEKMIEPFTTRLAETGRLAIAKAVARLN